MLQRSAEWRNELILFTAGAKVCPQNAKVKITVLENWYSGINHFASEEFTAETDSVK